MYVFRECHRVAPAGRLLTELAEAVSRAGSSHQHEEVQDALLRAGELECSLADSGQQAAAAAVAGVTDCLASALVCGDRLAVSRSCLQILKATTVSGEVALKDPRATFEQAGLPAAVICSDAFVVTADAMAELRGAPGYRYISTAHPVAVLSTEQVRQRAKQLLPEIVALLTERQ